jgi:protein-serine/threonine kinase
MKPVLAHVAEEDITDVGFTPLAVPQEAYIPTSAPQTRRSSADPASRRGSVDRASRKGSVDQPTSRVGSVSKPSGVVQYSDEGTLKIYEDGSHEHVLKPVKIMEKIPAGSGILSGFLRRNSANGNDAAFSLLPEQNRMDFQRRLSIQSRKTFDETDEDTENDSEIESEEEAEGSEDEGEFSLKAAIGDNQLSLINRLVEKINNSEDPSIVEKNYKLTEKYGKPQGIVGKGAYGTVKLVSKIDLATKKEIFYAVKELKQKENEEVSHFSTRLTSEFVISNSLQHLNIVRTIDLMKNSCGVYSEVMEYCAAGDLYNWISKTNREGLHYLEADCFIRQIMNGLSYMHSRGVAHCDIKPENILLTTQGIAKISDFGTSAVFRTAWEKECHFSAGACGSEPYVAPEEFTEKKYDPRCVDVWAAGVLYLTMATGTYLWPAAKLDEPLYEEYIDARPKPGKYAKFEPIENLKSGAYFKSRKATLYAMLDPSPMTRITTHQALKSSWLQQVKLCEAAQDYDIHV